MVAMTYKNLLPLLALACSAGTSWAQIDPTKVVLTVNGEDVRGGEYYRRMELLPGIGKRIGASYVELPPGLFTLDQLITERLVLQLAKQKGAYPSDPEVEQEIRFRLEGNPKLLEDLKAGGRSEEEFRYEVRYQLAQFKIQTFGVIVTDQDIDRVYKSRPQDYTIPKRYTLRVIVVGNDADAKAVDDDLKKGSTFAAVAGARSLDISKADGGSFGTLPVTALQPVVVTALEAVKIGQVTDWIPSEQRRIKFLLENVLPQEVQPLTPALRREIRKREMLARGSVKNDIEKEMKEIRTKAQIDIKDKAFAEAYKEFIESYLKGG
jgi:foldase protein PrsA